MGQPPQLDELLQHCTVKLLVPEGHGTGFFVASRLILTCAHVVKTAQVNKSLVPVLWNGQSYSAQLAAFEPEADLALLMVDLSEQPCVLLHREAKPFTKLYSYGFPNDYPNGAS